MAAQEADEAGRTPIAKGERILLQKTSHKVEIHMQDEKGCLTQSHRAHGLTCQRNDRGKNLRNGNRAKANRLKYDRPQ